MTVKVDVSAGAPRVRQHWQLLRQIVSWSVLVLIAWAIWPSPLGGDTSIVIVSGESMEPTYKSGDLVIARDVPVQKGDVIVYAPNSLGGAQIVHRVIGGDATAGWQLQGDNNDFVDPFLPTGDEVRGVVKLHIPNVGSVAMWFLNPFLWGGLILNAVVIAIWPGSRNEDDHLQIIETEVKVE